MKKTNVVMGIVMSLVPVAIFLGVNVLASVVIEPFYMPQVLRNLFPDGVVDPEVILNNQQLIVEALLETNYLGVATVICDALVALICFLWWRKIRTDEIPLKKAFSWKRLGVLALIGIGIQGGLNLIMSLLFVILPHGVSESYSELSEGLLGGGSTSVMMAIAVVICAPVCEDLMMRGIALNYGRKYVNTTFAIVASSVAFGLMHLSNLSLGSFAGVLIQVIYAIAIGLILAAVAVKYKSVWAGVFVHFVVNGSGQLMSLLNISEDNQNVFQIVVWVVGVAAAIGAILLIGKTPAAEALTYGEEEAAAKAADEAVKEA